MMKRRSFVAIAVFAAILGIGGVGAAYAQTAAVKGAFTAEQYKKALWMVTRFYGAQRSGEGPNWLLMDHTYKTSFVKDADGSYNLAGGWFDCGDHVLFGQTFFYSAYMLALGYDVFPTGYYDFYHGKDYSDYAEAQKWEFEDGKPNTIPDLLEELKYATDWIIKATPNSSTFYSQKGDGDADHKKWVTSGYMSTLAKADGGEKDGSRSIVKNPVDRPMPSYAAATLAVMSRIYRKYDSAYADTCLAHAKNAYAYAKAQGSSASVSAAGGFYPALGGTKVPMVFHIAAAEMYKTTNENTYLNDMKKEQIGFHNWGFDYDNPHDIAAYASAATFTENKQSYIDNIRTTFLAQYTSSGKINGEGVTTWGNEWGAMRYLSNHAFTAALYSRLTGTSEYDQFIYNQVDYILGKNSRNYSFLVGFNERTGGQAAQKPHHRNVYLNDNNVEVKNTLSIPQRNKSFGYMVGGHRDPSKYEDNVDKYQSTEGGLDYQAGLVGVLAYIVSKLDPADTSKFGVVEPPPPIQTPTTIKISLSENPSDAASFITDSVLITDLYKDDSGKTLYARVFDQDGIIIDNVICDNMTWTFTVNGTLPPSVPISPDLPVIPFANTVVGCSFTVPKFDDAVITSITVNYVYAGADKPSINKSIIVYEPEPPISVLPRNISLAKQGYAMTVKPRAVTFTAAAGREITGLSIYNIQGKRIFAASGKHKEISWNRDNSPRGMYLFKMTLNNGSVVQKNLILK